MCEYASYLESPVGLIKITADNHAVKTAFITSETGSETESEITKEAKKQLSEYFSGERKEFFLPLSPEGTEFQQKIWRELVKVPYGKTVSYGGIARASGNPKGAGAAGGAVGKNPIFIIIPCHRVISGDGGIGGFTGDLEIKKTLLNFESEIGKRGAKK